MNFTRKELPMNRTSRILQVLSGVALAFLLGVAAMAAQDAASQHGKGGQHGQQAAAPAQPAPAAKAQPAAQPGHGEHTYAPALPGWIKKLPHDKQEVAIKIWLSDGRAMVGYKELLVAKRHELNALLALPNVDDKAIQAVVREISSTEEKLLNADIAFRRKLEKEGIPTWGRMEHSMHKMMMGDEGGMMGGKGMGMMHGKDGDGHGAGGQDHGQKAAAAPEAAKAPEAKPAQ
jgi:hypothetical protein